MVEKSGGFSFTLLRISSLVVGCLDTMLALVVISTIGNLHLFGSKG